MENLLFRKKRLHEAGSQNLSRNAQKWPTHHPPGGVAPGERREDMYDKLYEKLNALYERLDNLEGCEDNPIYAKEISEIRAEISDIKTHQLQNFSKRTGDRINLPPFLHYVLYIKTPKQIYRERPRKINFKRFILTFDNLIVSHNKNEI